MRNYFTKKEVEATGAKFEDVQSVTLVSMNKLRFLLGRRIHLLANGLTSGKHSSIEHPKGLAVDFHLNNADGSVDPNTVFKCALEAGFKGIGVYENKEGVFSFHVDLRPNFAFWKAHKDENNNWIYTPIF